VLALVLAGVVQSGDASIADPIVDFLTDLAISTVLGIAFGILLSIVVSDRRAGVWKESAAIAVVAVVAVGYFSTDSAGGSGYLGAFLAGLIVGNMDRLGLGMHTDHERDMRSLVGTVTEVVVILVFITLGANLPWSDIWDNLAAALVVVVVGLIVLARPVTVLLCLGADRRGRWTREELVFMSWTRETGVVAAALAGLMVARDIPHAELIVTTVAARDRRDARAADHHESVARPAPRARRASRWLSETRSTTPRLASDVRLPPPASTRARSGCGRALPAGDAAHRCTAVSGVRP
jgi:cell volume regulation protein A